LKYLSSFALALSIGTLLAVGCVDDDRPLVSLPVGGEPGSGGDGSGIAGEPAAQGGSQALGGDGSGPEGGAPVGAGGAPAGEGGALHAGGSGEAGAKAAAGAGGDGAVEPAPFAGPYGAVYVGPTVGVDTRFPAVATWRGGSLVHFLSENDEEHAIGTALSLDTGSDGGVVQWGRWASGTLGGDDVGLTLDAEQGFHFGIGQLTPNVPASGTASYQVVGFTRVTRGDGSKPSTDLVAAGATASFGATTKVGLTINLSIDGTSYVVVTTGTYADPSDSELTTWDAEHPARFGGIPLEPSQGICADGCNRTVQGFFAGAGASHLVIVVHLFDDAAGSATSISSVIVMKKQ
jgi:hypothetical protein